MAKSSKKKKSKIFRLLVLVVLVSANTFAWFIYATKIDGSVSVHVKGWDVLFEAGENQVSNIINVNVDSIYPGMTNYHYEVKAYNRSEMSASLSYEIIEVRLLNTTYISVEGRAHYSQSVQPTDLTSAQLESKLLNDYPFSLAISKSSTNIQAGTGIEKVSFDLTWPYENNNDEEDTEWGCNASNYKNSNPSSPTIAIKLKITITQNPN